LNSVDLPTFGSPTMPSLSIACDGVWASGNAES
jgi:hypothetical protein